MSGMRGLQRPTTGLLMWLPPTGLLTMGDKPRPLGRGGGQSSINLFEKISKEGVRIITTYLLY